MAYTPCIHSPVLAITRPAISFIIHINEMYRERRNIVSLNESRHTVKSKPR